MRRSGQGSGGGYGSRNVSHVSEPKREPKPYGRNPAAVAQLGNKVGNHVTSTVNTNYSGDEDWVRKGYAQPVGPTSFSNVGVGGGRKIYGSGSQCQHGSANPGNPQPTQGDILNEYGPNIRR